MHETDNSRGADGWLAGWLETEQRKTHELSTGKAPYSVSSPVCNSWDSLARSLSLLQCSHPLKERQVLDALGALSQPKHFYYSFSKSLSPKIVKLIGREVEPGAG